MKKSELRDAIVTVLMGKDRDNMRATDSHDNHYIDKILKAVDEYTEGEVAKETEYRLKREKESRERMGEISSRLECCQKELNQISLITIQEQLSQTVNDPNLTIIT